MQSTPIGVTEAVTRAETAAFSYSSEPEAGRLLAALAAAVPTGGRILELGTGIGVGVAWILHGLGNRTDVEVVTVEYDEATAAIAAQAAWPPWVGLRIGDAEQLLPKLGTFDLIFADAPAGKWTGLDLTIAALAPRGVLLVDDMDLARYHNPEHVASVENVRRTLLTDPRLTAADLPTGSGFILATRH
ncbi:O-methyltransferase [Actinoplanes aureus]|uniref:Class I SAM-dependent methyltransferase n=1 Tax=Actinoplanes aureus TaxID=2792083 RepID=A0A931CQ17_9ACTN|nr:class I SAM-dependent methyltransferase [Actinoplanes aureus]MBG0568990.1 class I SAM-dependent methyltransferase [Actinoplanes aureus]